jgi:hypothetical protein
MVQYSLAHVSSRSRHHVVRPTARSMRTPPHSFLSPSHCPYGSFFFITIAQSVDTASYVFEGLISLCTFASLDIELDSLLYLAFSLYSIPRKPLPKAINSDPDSTARPGSETPGANSKQTITLTLFCDLQRRIFACCDTLHILQYRQYLL